MLKKLIVALLAVLFAGLGAGLSQAEPGPNGNNDHGLCTAYFNGQKVGHGREENQTNQPPPFQGLEDAARAYTDNDGSDNDNDGEPDEEGENTELSDAENIFNFCHDTTVIGGNPEHGRFTCDDSGALPTDGSDDQSDPECNTNEKPGKG